VKGRKPFSKDLELHPGEEPVNLLAYRLAQRLFWYHAVHGEEETLQEIYDRLVRLLREGKLPLTFER
jgi:hypothetical protein